MDLFNRINFFTEYKDVNISSEENKVNEGKVNMHSEVVNMNNEVVNMHSEIVNVHNEVVNMHNEVVDVIIDSKNDTNDTNNTNDTNDTNNTNDTNSSFIYDILHIFDNIYSYGRTFIENNYFNLSENDDFNLVYPNIYIGNYSTSTNSKLLKDLGMTHIISVIPYFNPPFEGKFKYLHIEAYDDESQDIKHYFEISNEFIHTCLNEGGKILIHCMDGKSPSVTIFLSFLIYIVQGNFNKNILNLYNNNNDDNDIYSSIEYNKFIKINNDKKNNSFDGINNNNKNQLYYNNSNNYEKINTIEHIKPKLNNREKNFIIYKKENMINDVDELINTYNILKKEITIKKKSIDSGDSGNSANKNINDLNTIIKNMKTQSGTHFIIQLIKYIQKYRSIANPNPYFINQLSDNIF